jgi:hypothetical protein
VGRHLVADSADPVSDFVKTVQKHQAADGQPQEQASKVHADEIAEIGARR